MHWPFSPPAPRNRHTAIVDINGNMVQDQCLFTDYVINIAPCPRCTNPPIPTYANTRTFTRTPTNTLTPCPSCTNTPTFSPTNTPTNTPSGTPRPRDAFVYLV